MAEYIKRDVVMRGIMAAKWMDGYDGAMAMEIAASAPAADVAPVVHGRWEYTPQTFNTLGQIRCPFCAWWSLDPSIDGIYKYCPNCGAKMDGGDNDEAD